MGTFPKSQSLKYEFPYKNLKELKFTVFLFQENGAKIFITHPAQIKRSLHPLPNIICNQLASI